jgi:hypothetical protein
MQNFKSATEGADMQAHDTRPHKHGFMFWTNDDTFQCLIYNSLRHEQKVQLLSGLVWCIRVMQHYLAVFPSQQCNLTVIITSLKSSSEACNSHFTVILLLLSHVLIFSWAIKKSLFLTTKTCTKFTIWYLPLITNFNIACYNSALL